MAVKQYPNGTYEGDLIDDVPNGKGTFTVKDTGRKYIGEWKNGVYNGHGRFYYSDGEYHDGMWKDGKRHGPGRRYYSDRLYYEGVWADGRIVSGSYVMLDNGLPYDVSQRNGKWIYSPLTYEIDENTAPLAGKTLRCRHSQQSGFVIETPTSTFLFDWYRSRLPALRRDKPLHVFISHIHQDHFNSEIFSLAEGFQDVSFYLGDESPDDQTSDYLCGLLDQVSDRISCFRGRQTLFTNFGKVESFDSTDLGVAFLIQSDGMTLFHAGDLFPWGNETSQFCSFTEPLQGIHIDYAMLPLDPHFPEAAAFCIDRYLELADITCFTPMHLWDQPGFAEAFAARHPQYGRKMIIPNAKEEATLSSIEMMKPYNIEF